VISALLLAVALIQAPDSVPAERLAAREWYRDAKFGMFIITDHKYKSVAELIHYLVRAAGYGANLLLNIGPRPDGTIPPEAEARLREVGKWLEANGASINGTRAGPIAPRSWGVTGNR
jgi:alpha-L-fucosidase